MQKRSAALPALVLLGLLTACGQAPNTGAVPSSTPSVTTASPQSTPPGTQAPKAEVPPGAYDALLAGDVSGVENSDVWGDPPLGFDQLALEYATLDLDGDGVCELLIQGVDDPCGYNGVFHYGDGHLICWQNDLMETSCRDYPLQDGTMVRQYDTGTGPSRYSHLYTLFRYRTDGETETVAELSIHEDTGGDGAAALTYQIGGTQVTQAAFEARFDALVTSQLLERSAWIPLGAAASQET